MKGAALSNFFLIDSCHGWPIPLRECRCSTGEPTKCGGKNDEKRWWRWWLLSFTWNLCSTMFRSICVIGQNLRWLSSRTGSKSGIPGNQNVHRAQTTLRWLGDSGSCQGWATTTLAVSPQAADAPNCHPSEPPWRHVQGSKRRTLQVSQLDHPKQRQEKWKTSPRLPVIERKKRQVLDSTKQPWLALLPHSTVRHGKPTPKNCSSSKGPTQNSQFLEQGLEDLGPILP